MDFWWWQASEATPAVTLSERLAVTSYTSSPLRAAPSLTWWEGVLHIWSWQGRARLYLCLSSHALPRSWCVLSQSAASAISKDFGMSLTGYWAQTTQQVCTVLVEPHCTTSLLVYSPLRWYWSCILWTGWFPLFHVHIYTSCHRNRFLAGTTYTSMSYTWIFYRCHHFSGNTMVYMHVCATASYSRAQKTLCMNLVTLLL